MTSTAYTCWKCHAALDELLLPVPRLAQCKSCKAHLHVCRMCVFYDTTVSNQCREPIAEKVADKQRSNFCGYFTPNPDIARQPAEAGRQSAQSQLDALFGLAADPAAKKPALSAEEESKRKLAELFGLKDDKPS